MTESENIPEWFWHLIDETRPSLALLAESLESLSQAELEQWQRAYEAAAEAVCPYWDGPDMGGDFGVLSEDGTEDFCKWIVSQGRSLWQQATAPGADLNALVQLYWNSEQDSATEYPRWSTVVASPTYQGYQDPSYIAYPIYRARFNAELQ